MTVYIDLIFIENLIVNFLIIYLVSVICKSKKNIKRYIFASLIGAVFVVITYLINIKLQTNMLIKTILSILIIYVAFNPKKLKKAINYLLCFYIVSFIIGGMAFSFLSTESFENILNNNFNLISIPFKNTALAIIFGVPTIYFGYFIIKNNLLKRNEICKIQIYLNGKKAQVNSLIDTGNFLKEPISRKKCINCGKRSNKKHFM